MNDSDWLKESYHKAADDKNIDLQRKDSFTNWALVSLLGLLAVYGQYPALENTSFVLVGVAAIAIALVTRFYVHSVISYANIRKLNTILVAIEKHWMHADPTVDEIKDLIRTHGQLRWSVVRRVKAAWTQMKAGFLLLFLVPFVVLLYEMLSRVPDPGTVYQVLGVPYEYIILAALVGYMIYECTMFISYNPLKKKSPKEALSTL